MNIFCGTPSYMAPEIVKRHEYDGVKADIWALGVCQYRFTTKGFPFKGLSENELYKNIKNGNYEKPKHISKNLADLFSKQFTVDCEERCSIKTFLNHSWFKSSDIFSDQESSIIESDSDNYE